RRRGALLLVQAGPGRGSWNAAPCSSGSAAVADRHSDQARFAWPGLLRAAAYGMPAANQGRSDDLGDSDLPFLQIPVDVLQHGRVASPAVYRGVLPRTGRRG